MPNWTNPFQGITGMNLDYLNETPNAGWGAYLGGWGQGNDPFSQWLRGQQGRYYSMYQGENAKDPNLTWTNYLTTKINPQKEFAALDPYSRGERPQNWAGRTRWSL